MLLDKKVEEVLDQIHRVSRRIFIGPGDEIVIAAAISGLNDTLCDGLDRIERQLRNIHSELKEIKQYSNRKKWEY